jgi:hypothetical protein
VQGSYTLLSFSSKLRKKKLEEEEEALRFLQHNIFMK